MVYSGKGRSGHSFLQLSNLLYSNLQIEHAWLFQSFTDNCSSLSSACQLTANCFGRPAMLGTNNASTVYVASGLTQSEPVDEEDYLYEVNKRIWTSGKEDGDRKISC